MAADFTISQAGGAGAGTLNTELRGVWADIVVDLVAEPAAAYAWEILDRPEGASAALDSTVAQNVQVEPDPIAGRWRIQLTTPDGTRVLVFEVTKSMAGAVLDNGLGVTPAHLERPSEAGGRGAARVFERFRASLLALISSSPTASKLLLRDATGAAVAASFTGGSTLDTTVSSDASRKVLVGRPEDPRLRFDEDGYIYVDRWNGSAHVASGIVGAAVDALYMSDGAGTAEVILGPSSAAISSGGVCSLTAGTTLTLSAGSLDCAITNVSGTFLCSTDAPMRIQPAQAVSGAGRRNTFASGDGQTPGTHLAGGIVFQVGAPVAGVTDEVEFQRRDGTKLFGVKQFANGYVWADFGANIADIRAAAVVALRALTAVQYVSPKLQRFDPSGTNYRDETSLLSPATINTATDTNVGTGVAISHSDSTELIECTLGWWNKTDSTCGWRKFRRAFKRIGSTVTPVGSLVEDDAGSYVEAGETGVTCDFTISGIMVIPRITTPDTDERRAFAYPVQTKRLTW